MTSSIVRAQTDQSPPVARRQFLERRFEAFGVVVGLRCRDARLFAEVQHQVVDGALPPGWRDAASAEDGNAVTLRYDLRENARECRPRIFQLRYGAQCLAETPSFPAVLRALGAHAELQVAERSPDHLFVHAGVVAWDRAAVILPGHSHAGKTTLVRACLEAGATYYSDEYAVLDRNGRVHPYPRPLAIRAHAGGPVQQRTAGDLGAPIGSEPVPVAAILITSYRAGESWQPAALSGAQALLALMSHTVAARGNPAHSMPILKQTVAGAAAFAGPRGEAATVATRIRPYMIRRRGCPPAPAQELHGPSQAVL